MKLLLRNHRCAGDVLLVTAAVRDLHRAFPGRYVVAVDTPFPALWENNPLVVPVHDLGVPDRVIEVDCPGVASSNHRPVHFIGALVEDLERQLGVRIPVGACRGEIYLSPDDRSAPSPAAEAGLTGPYWVVVAGGKYDLTTKWWDPGSYQAVVDHFGERVQFVQCGQAGDWHPPLRNVLNLVGRTDLRQLIRLVYRADGVLCPITLAMHLAAAVPTPPGAPPRRACVVVAGGREAPHWEMYPTHQFLHTVGALDCCASGGCWKSRCQPVGDEVPDAAQACVRPVTVRGGLQIGKCMTMVTPARVVQAIETYYEGGMLRPARKAAVPPPSTRAAVPQSTPASRGGVAVTIGVGPYAELAHLAARELHRRTGLETVVLGDAEYAASGLEHPTFLKFRLLDLVGADDVLYFDADIVCLRPWDPRPYFGLPEIVAVRDRTGGLIEEESADWGIPQEDYFNAGMFFLSRPHHAGLLRLAESLRFERPTPLLDQSPMNAARVRLNVPLRLLDRRYNWLGYGGSTLSHQMPVVLAHRLVPGSEDLNLSYFRGECPLPPACIQLNDVATQRLRGRRLLYSHDGGPARPIVLRGDGTMTPPVPATEVGYWFVHDVNGRPVLSLASETRELHRLVEVRRGVWMSAAPQDRSVCADEAACAEVPLTVNNARPVADRFVESIPPRPQGTYRGRGIVMCGGDKYFPCAWVCIRMLRHLGCTLPVELWQLCESELGAPMRAALEPYSVRCVDAAEVRERHPVRTLDGWELKPYAILHSAFEEVLFLDADNVPVRDPTYLFHSEPYRRHGAVFWPDLGRLAPEAPIWKICGVPHRDEPEFETGQVLVNKLRCWEALHLTMHLNEHSDFYYNYVHGDKETFHMAWRMLGRDYAMVPTPVQTLAGTMCQHDFEGRRLFQHRNTAKWSLKRMNRRVEGFRFEELCLEYLEELRQQIGAPGPVEPWVSGVL